MLEVMLDISIPNKDLFNEGRLKNMMQEHGLAAVVGLSPASVTYLSGYHNLDMLLLRDFLHAVIWPIEGTPTLLMCENLNPRHTFVHDVRMYPIGSGRNTGIGPLVDILREKDLGGERVGIEKQVLSAHTWDVLRQEFPKVRWTDGSDVIERTRHVKTAKEVELLRAAARTTDRAISQAYTNARPTDTEKSVGDAMSYNVMRLGADIVVFNVLASGTRTPKGHFLGEDIPLEKGTIMRCDFGALFDGYFTDLARMAVVGGASQRQKDTYANLYEVQQRGLAAIRPGITGQDLFNASLEGYAELGIGTRPMVGHSIGLTVHERPFLATGEEWYVEEGMVICVENGGMGAGEYNERYHIEDMILVTGSGYEILSDYSDTTMMTVIE